MWDFKRARISILFLFLISCSSAFAQEDSSGFFRGIDSISAKHFRSPNSLNLMNRTFDCFGTGKDSVYKLPDEFIINESESIDAGTLHLRRGLDYEVNYRFGEIRFNFLLAQDIAIHIAYQILPFKLKSEYYHRAIARRTVFDESEKKTTEKNIVVSNVGSANMFESSQITGTGSITRGFTVGSNQNLALNSGLNVQIAGNISDDVTLEASLTDENTPIQPEGNTENLQQIDKVYVEVKKGNSYAATFGDFDVNLSGTEFGDYSRKLQGIRGFIHNDKVIADVALGSAKGKYTSNTLTVIEGVQGPYILTGQNGEKNILVIAGTEKIWLNGVLLSRGENNDYVVDYSAGQISFTRRRLIAAESRVVADFEYSDEIFRRTSVSAGIETHWLDNRVTFGGRFVSEYDDKNNPINLSLSNHTIDSLSHIDDSKLAPTGSIIYVDGATRVDFGKGAYIKVFEAAVSESIYVYVGSDSLGDYNVRFTDVGTYNGDYVRGNILGEFVFAGKKLGNFLPLVPLPLPTSAQLASFFMKLNPTNNILINGEAAFSTFDKNSFSPKGQDGMAYNLKAHFQKQKVHFRQSGLGELDFDGRWRHLDSTFHELNRVNDAEFNRTWNIPKDLASTQSSFGIQEDVRDAALRYRPVNAIQFNSFYGYLQRGDHVFNSTRYGGGVESHFKEYPELNYSTERINSNTSASSLYTEVTRQKLYSQYQIWKALPSFDYQDEHVRNTLSKDSIFGTSYNTYRPKLDFNGFKKTQFGIMLEKRYDRIRNERVDSLNGTMSVSTTQRYYWNVTDWKNFNSSIEFIERRQTFRDKFKSAGNPNKLTKLVNSTVDYYPWHRAVSVNLNYQVTDELIQDRKIIFIPVTPNTGNFIQVSQDSFKQVPQGQGDWVQGSVRGDNFTPIVELKFGTRLRIDVARFFEYAKHDSTKNGSDSSAWRRLIRNVSTETVFRVEENQEAPDLSFYFINLRKYQNDRNTARGSILFRQDLYANQSNSDFSLRLRYEFQKSLSTLLINGNDRRLRELENIRARKQLGPSMAVENEMEYEINRKNSTITVSGLSRDFNLYRFKTTPLLSYRPMQEVEIINKGSFAIAKDKISSIEARSWSYAPEVIYSFNNKGRLDLSATVTKIFLNETNLPLLFELTEGHARGWNANWLCSLDYRISGNVSIAFNYSGRKEPRQSVVHLGSAEFRAFF